MFLSSVGIGLGGSAQKMKSTKIRAQQILIKLQYTNGGWTNTESLISAKFDKRICHTLKLTVQKQYPNISLH